MLTEKGTQIFELILNKYQVGEEFRAKDIGAASATLTSIVKEGYLDKKDTKPLTYLLKEGAEEEYEKRKPKKFNPYSYQEFKKQQELTYDELCKYLINKYGIVDGNYFCTESCSSQNSKIRRGKEGLFIHHYYEKDFIMLCNKEWAVINSFEYQMGKNLIYCNIFEHLLLHIKIALNEFSEEKLPNLVGIGGIVNFIAPKIFYEYKVTSQIENINKQLFDNIMEDFFNLYLKSSQFLVTNFPALEIYKKQISYSSLFEARMALVTENNTMLESE